MLPTRQDAALRRQSTHTPSPCCQHAYGPSHPPCESPLPLSRVLKVPARRQLSAARGQLLLFDAGECCARSQGRAGPVCEPGHIL